MGHNLGVACRFFDKGNSLAVKELKQYVDALFTCEVTEMIAAPLLERLKRPSYRRWKVTWAARILFFWDPRRPLPAFAERFGRSTRRAMEAFIKEVSVLLGGPAANWMGSWRTPLPGLWEPDIRLSRAP